MLFLIKCLIYTNMKYLKSFNESKVSTAMDRHEGYISSEKQKEIFDIVDDCLMDLKDDRYDIMKDLVDDDEEFKTWEELLGLELVVRIYRNEHFSIDDVKDYINDLISHLDGIFIDLKDIKYRVYTETFNTSRNGGKWYSVSMDPTNGEVEGNTFVGIKDTGGRFVSDIKNLVGVELRFT